MTTLIIKSTFMNVGTIFLILTAVFLSASCKDILGTENVEPTESIEDGLLFHLPLDNNGVDSVNSNHLTIVRDGVYVQDRNRNELSALSLNGSSSFVDIISPLSAAQDFFSLSYWVKSFSLSSGRSYVIALRQESYFDMFFELDELVVQAKFSKALASDPSFFVRSQVTTAEWAHIVVRYDKSDSIEIFVNGTLADRITDMSRGVFSENDSSVNSAIGCLNLPGRESDFWEGIIDDIRIYDRLLSDEEVTFLANN